MISKSLIVLSTTTTASIYSLAALELIFLLVSLGVQAAFRMEYSDIKHVRRLSVVLIFSMLFLVLLMWQWVVWIKFIRLIVLGEKK